jgi:hypothetical protein
MIYFIHNFHHQLLNHLDKNYFKRENKKINKYNVNLKDYLK